MFSIYDVIGSDNLDYVLVNDIGYRKLQVPPPSIKSNRELTAATATVTQTQTKEYFSIYDSIG